MIKQIKFFHIFFYCFKIRLQVPKVSGINLNIILKFTYNKEIKKCFLLKKFGYFSRRKILKKFQQFRNFDIEELRESKKVNIKKYTYYIEYIHIICYNIRIIYRGGMILWLQ